MTLAEIPCRLYTLTCEGEPLLMYGTYEDGRIAVLWPMPALNKHPIAFLRWSKRYVENWRGKRLILQHELCATTLRWVKWLGVNIEQGEVMI